MKQEIMTKTGKKVEFPLRMFRASELEDMGASYFEKQIFFNKANFGEALPVVSDAIANNMAVCDYVDCSDTNFSNARLQDAVTKQLASNSDMLTLSAFKNETPYETRTRLRLAEQIKKGTDKEIVFEISYKSGISTEELVKASASFDYLVVFYGVHYGHLPSFNLLCKQVTDFKWVTGKKVFCTAVPLIFAGDSRDKSSYLIPIWEMVADGWIKNWRRGGGGTQIKLVDYQDFKNKTYTGWLENKHRGDELVPQLGNDVTVYELFRKSKQAEKFRGQYKAILLDEALAEVANLNDSQVDVYVSDRVPFVYRMLAVSLYRVKLILLRIRDATWLKEYATKDRSLIEEAFAKGISISELDKAINHVESLLKNNTKIPAATLIREIEIFRENN